MNVSFQNTPLDTVLTYVGSDSTDTDTIFSVQMLQKSRTKSAYF